MFNKSLNPLIQRETSDTLNLCNYALSYIWESIDKLELAELSRDGQNGLCWLLITTIEALKFEHYYCKQNSELKEWYESLDSLDGRLYQHADKTQPDKHR